MTAKAGCSLREFDMQRRARKAAGILAGMIAGMLVVVALSAAISNMSDSDGETSSLVSVQTAQASALTTAASILSGEGAGEVIEGQVDASALPAEFCDEVFSPEAEGELYFDAEACVFSMTTTGNAADVFSSLSAELQNKGWQVVESGWDAAGSLYKEEGSYTWLFLMCYQVGDDVSVVVQYR